MIVRDVWKFATAKPGAQFVMTSGMSLMQELLASSSATPEQVIMT